MPIRWCGRPGGQTYDLHRIKSTSFIWFAGERKALMTHWVESLHRTMPCTHPPCRYHQEPISWKAYAAAMLYDMQEKTWSPIILEIPAALDNLLPKVLRDLATKITRSDGKWSSKEAKVQPAGELPPAWDIEPTLYALWGMEPARAEPKLRPETLKLKVQ